MTHLELFDKLRNHQSDARLQNDRESLEFAWAFLYRSRQTLTPILCCPENRILTSKCIYTPLNSAMKSKVNLKRKQMKEREALYREHDSSPRLSVLCKMRIVGSYGVLETHMAHTDSVHGSWCPGHHLSCTSCRKSLYSCRVLLCSFTYFYLYLQSALSLLCIDERNLYHNVYTFNINCKNEKEKKSQ